MKDEGKGSFRFYAEEMNDKSFEKLFLESNFRNGLENDEFVVFYQPKIDIRTQKIIGMEALIRWNCPDRGMIPPFQFISLAEETGFIIPLTNWIFRTTCSQLNEWKSRGFPDLNLAVNISPLHFKRDDFIPSVESIINESNVDPSQLEFEITESIFLENVDLVHSKMLELKKMGIKIAMDDFGTGYSSLSSLKQLPIDTLKIDQSFIRDVTDSPDAKAIAKTIVSMAHLLDMKVVAEGVETESHLDFLRAERCDIAQGYFFSRPIPSEDFVGLLKSN